MEKDFLANPRNVRFKDLLRVCDECFGEFGRPRVRGSHHIYKTPWPGNPRINIQEDKSGKAKVYEVEQVKEALEKLEQWRKGRKLWSGGDSRNER